MVIKMNNTKNKIAGLIALLGLSGCAASGIASKCDIPVTAQAAYPNVNKDDRTEVYRITRPFELYADGIEQRILLQANTYDISAARKAGKCRSETREFIDPADNKIRYSIEYEICATGEKGDDSYLVTRRGLHETRPAEVVLRIYSADGNLTGQCASLKYREQPCCDDVPREQKTGLCSDFIIPKP